MKADWKMSTAAAGLFVGLAAFPLAAYAGSETSESSAKEVEAEMTESAEAGAEADTSGEEVEASGEETEAATEQTTQDSEELPGEDPGANPEIEGTADDKSEESN